ncbi:serine/threonine-protein kinase 17B [Myiozetetes cayanensis]|uniref:serine/threonine-protein kinase 17B n=1 Tax=Myiozetetes cayanensis TaxID=478635 RepID=UPI00215E0012|nr:serine/threonine-protein kinase 17B [Myiozetetes cayanensis]XP_050195752.1 serine/threonine-protein kinase 17B [Myiozetetes cayanensis]XP_050195753.1 serine/threonine-protein kinase 17B [Myiozetetes cayanensis]XP_050195754.1 serine/threonine-protein kinase 17B [Myiozetetes cayanensis]XP_050195755.1 serine/threonine-protein kinase 17B [Myiozetetes cayanensis]XP_050195756.1 serine/threonine-protein kinase 17B [Myiozetetes cayanensis]
MSRRKLENKSLSGLLDTPLHTTIKTENFHNFYTLESKQLGRGRSAVVRKCVAKSTGQEYAAKFLKKRRRGQDCKAEIHHEIAVLELMKSNPRIVNLHEVYETANEIILVLEYAAGGEIFDLCVPDLDYRIGERDIVRLIRQILEGLCCLHENNIVHLDLKPQNILLSSINPLGDVKIVDFGISRKLENSSELRHIMGTTEYLAPEILNYDPITTATDMWNIGVISYMLLTQESPFVGADIQETYLNISQVNVDYSEETFASVSQPAKDFIQKLLIKNPEERPTAADCLSHLWLQQGEFTLLCGPEETCCSSQVSGHTAKCSEERNVKSSCNGTCGDKEDKENIPEDSSTLSKRFRFDDSLQYPQDFTTDFLC